MVRNAVRATASLGGMRGTRELRADEISRLTERLSAISGARSARYKAAGQAYSGLTATRIARTVGDEARSIIAGGYIFTKPTIPNRAAYNRAIARLQGA
jgi:hypothetical protein